MPKQWTKLTLEVNYDLEDAFKIIERGKNNQTDDSRKIGLNVIDHFLYCGKFNSVMGPDGFGLFKDHLKDVLKKVNDDDFGTNYMNLDKIFEVLLASGVYYVEEHLPAELTDLNKNPRWLTAYRYIAKNFPNISYGDFREIVKRLQDTSGHSIYIVKNDSQTLQNISNKDRLFNEVLDTRAALLPLTQKQLREICEKVGASPARSTAETVDRIVEIAADSAMNHIPDEHKGRRSLLIKDTDLATGQDIIDLDVYLRAIAKVVREDLAQFIDKRRSWNLDKERKVG